MRETFVGIDFAGPASAAAQRRKILAVEASRIGSRRYEISTRGLNAQLLRAPPGWTAAELAEALAGSPAVSVIAADFPFSIPAALLADEPFARRVGERRALRSWAAFNRAVAAALPLRCPLDYGPFRGWRDRRHWLRRATDACCGAQPALKDRFQVLFNMTLLGNAFLARLDATGRFDVVPFQARGRVPVVEVYPGHVMRALGVRSYKRAPRAAIEAALRHLAERGIAVAVDPAVRAVCERYDTGRGGGHDHDAADALVAACVAILHREGKARELVGAAPGAREVEGAIWSLPAPPPRAATAQGGGELTRARARARRSPRGSARRPG